MQYHAVRKVVRDSKSITNEYIHLPPALCNVQRDDGISSAVVVAGLNLLLATQFFHQMMGG